MIERVTPPRAPVVTVIVPGYDVAEFAPEALDSLRAQTLVDWTAVLVDDGSIDGTGMVFDDAAADDPRFQVVHHRVQSGLSAARNTGLDLVETPLVAFLDADDRYTPRALELLVGAVTESGSDVAVGAYVRLRPDAVGGYTAGEVQPWVAAATDPARRRATLEDHPDVSGNIVAHTQRVSERFQSRLRAFAAHPLVGEARGVGLIGAVELVADKIHRTPFAPERKVGLHCSDRCLDQGLIIRNLGDAIAFCPPLVITESEIDELFDRFARALDATAHWLQAG